MKDREQIIQAWDRWHKYLTSGGKGTWPRDEFEALLDSFEEELKPVIKFAHNIAKVLMETALSHCFFLIQQALGEMEWDEAVEILEGIETITSLYIKQEVKK